MDDAEREALRHAVRFRRRIEPVMHFLSRRILTPLQGKAIFNCPPRALL
jgi:hypothetical protein